MSGTVCGLLDTYMYLSTSQSQQSAFTHLYRFFERMVAVGNAQRVALQYGSGGTGTGYYAEANPFGENAFFVYKLLESASTERDYDLYVMAQWADSQTFGNSPGNPGSSYQSDCNAITMAFREDGTSPWAGTTNNDGTDTKGTPVWTAGGSTLHVMDRACSPAVPTGTYNTNKERMMSLGDFYTGSNRHIIIGDADGIIYLNQPNNADDWVINYLGMYIPRTGLTIDYPIVALVGVTAVTDVFYNLDYGTQGGTTGNNGGIIGSNNSDSACITRVRMPTDLLLEVGLQPNNQINPAESDEFPIFLYNYEYSTGLCGQIPPNLIACVGYGTPPNTMSADGTRAYVGFNNLINIKLSIPWDGVAPPGSGTAFLGRLM